jgi:hypothetical protein
MESIGDLEADGEIYRDNLLAIPDPHILARRVPRSRSGGT